MTRDTIMAYIAEHPGCSLSEICNSAGCTTRAGQSNIAYILRNLVADGKLVRAKARTGRGIVERSYRYWIPGDCDIPPTEIEEMGYGGCTYTVAKMSDGSYVLMRDGTIIGKGATKRDAECIADQYLRQQGNLWRGWIQGARQ